MENLNALGSNMLDAVRAPIYWTAELINCIEGRIEFLCDWVGSKAAPWVNTC